MAGRAAIFDKNLLVSIALASNLVLKVTRIRCMNGATEATFITRAFFNSTRIQSSNCWRRQGSATTISKFS